MIVTHPPKESFTCITCQVVFKDSEIQRLHYKSDWHRYNLKRKVAFLPPKSSEEFQLRVINQRNLDNIPDEPKNLYCQVCKKQFSNFNAFDNHLNSKRHKDNEKNYVERPKNDVNKVNQDLDEISTDSSEEWNEENPIDNNNCLFCTHHSRNFIKNLEHMTVAHSFFIPDIEYCVDIHGLVRYLGEKISEGFMCLWCNEKGRTFYSIEAARNHMIDKGHCKMIHEGVALAEYADYYDYSSSYPDANSKEIDIDEEVSIPEINDSEYELTLPSGIVVGHRSLMRYYKQKLNPNNEIVTTSKSTRKLHKILSTYRALGWTSTQQEEAARKAKDIHYMKRLQSKLCMKLGVKGNKLQKHFRPQVNF